MNDIKRILVVSRMTQQCCTTLSYGVSLSEKYGAELYVIHVIHDIFGTDMTGWNLSIPSLQEEYKKSVQKIKEDLDAMIREDKRKGVPIKEMLREGDPTEEILKAVKEEHIDLLVMSSQAEGRLEHLLFGRSTEKVIRQMPCSILLVKKEPEQVSF